MWKRKEIDDSESLAGSGSSIANIHASITMVHIPAGQLLGLLGVENSYCLHFTIYSIAFHVSRVCIFHNLNLRKCEHVVVVGFSQFLCYLSLISSADTAKIQWIYYILYFRCYFSNGHTLLSINAQFIHVRETFIFASQCACLLSLATSVQLQTGISITIIIYVASFNLLRRLLLHQLYYSLLPHVQQNG